VAVGQVIPVLLAAGALLLAAPAVDTTPSPSASAPPVTRSVGGSYSVFGGTFTLPAGERRDGNVSIYGGDADIQGTVTHDLRVYGGTATVDGEIGHDVVVLGGSVTLGPHAKVGHDVTVVGGAVDRDPGAQIGHAFVEGGIGGGDLPGLPGMPQLPEAPRLGGLDLGLGIGLSIGVVLLALLVQLFFPAHLATTRDALEDRPLASLGFGCLTSIAGVLLAVLLGITVLLLPVSFAIAVAMGLAWLLGVAAAILLIGQRLAAALRLQIDPVTTLLLGGLLVAILVNVPILGGLVGLVLGAMALGAVVLTRFGTRPHPPYPPPVPPPGEVPR
jgi:hypothetical protein